MLQLLNVESCFNSLLVLPVPPAELDWPDVSVSQKLAVAEPLPLLLPTSPPRLALPVTRPLAYVDWTWPLLRPTSPPTLELPATEPVAYEELIVGVGADGAALKLLPTSPPTLLAVPVTEPLAYEELTGR
jgi:hypothetical protein